MRASFGSRLSMALDKTSGQIGAAPAELLYFLSISKELAGKAEIGKSSRTRAESRPRSSRLICRRAMLQAGRGRWSLEESQSWEKQKEAPCRSHGRLSSHQRSPDALHLEVRRDRTRRQVAARGRRNYVTLTTGQKNIG